jgi:flagellar hook-basal body complex protein FliE
VTIPPINPSAILGGEWQIPGIGGISPVDGNVPGAAPTDTGGGFGSMLSQQIGRLSDLQDNAASASRALADGTATDPSTVVVAVEKAQLAMQLAGTIRTKGAEAVNDIFHTQI